MKKIFMILVTGIMILQAWTIQDDPYYKHKKSQFEMLSQNTKYTTTMLGDSITDEGQWNELLDNAFIQNRGISGDTTTGVLERLDSINKSIKQVFIMIGVNDIMRGKNINEVYSNYIRIIKHFQEKNIKVYIQSTLFIGEKRAGDFNIKVEELNKKLKNFALKNSIVFIDLNKKLAANKTLKKEYSFDGLHLNGTAYTIWANEIKKYF